MAKEPVNVVINYSYDSPVPLTDDCRHEIERISPRIKVSDMVGWRAIEEGNDTDAQKRLETALAEAEIYCGFPEPSLLERATNLRWIQSAIAGVNQFLTPDIIARPVVLTKAKIHDQQISETIFSMMLMLARRSLEYFRAQERKERIRPMPSVLHSKTLGILGLGNIGQATARIAKAFGMRVIATRAHPEKRNRHVDVMLPPGGLHELLAQSDYVVVLLPITKETANLIGEAELRMMKPTAYVINVARGGIIDQDAIVHALREKWIAGAGLDVLASDPGPVPDDVWELKNLILTPHLAGQREDYFDVLTKHFCQNLRRYLSGRELLNIVDKNAGY